MENRRITMANKAKQKGDRAEREIVHLHTELGIAAQRVPLSGAAGGLFAGNVVIADMKAEVKARKSGNGFKTLEGGLGANDILFLRRDRQKPLVLLPWPTYQKLMRRHQTEIITSED